MSDNPFAPPSATGGGFSPADHAGRLLLIIPTSIERGIKTAYGESDAVAADVAILDGEHSGTTFESSLIFPTVLRSQLSRQIGQKVLARLGQGTAKPGQSPPWVLQEADDDDVEVGKRFLDHDLGKKFVVACAGVTAPTPAAAEPEKPKATTAAPF